MSLIPAKDYKMFMKHMPIVCIDGVVVNENGEYLLVKRKNEPLKGKYWIPGGRLLKNEKLEDAIKRKMNQELGVDVKVEKLLGFFEIVFDKTSFNISRGFHAISFVFLLRLLKHPIKLDNQSSDWKWSKKLPRKLQEIIQPFNGKPL